MLWSPSFTTVNTGSTHFCTSKQPVSKPCNILALRNVLQNICKADNDLQEILWG